MSGLKFGPSETRGGGGGGAEKDLAPFHQP